MRQAVRDLAAGGITVLLTTQYLDEAEQSADRIAILHEGRIIEERHPGRAQGPAAAGEGRVRRQPTLEDVFLTLVGHDGRAQRPRRPTTATTHFLGDTALLTGRSLRHITRSLDTIITTTIMPIAFLLLFVFVLGGAIETGSGTYIDYLLPGILIITVASGVSYTAYRLFRDLQAGSSSGSTRCRSPDLPCCGRTCSPRLRP